jgi:hypothetical protein
LVKVTLQINKFYKNVTEQSWRPNRSQIQCEYQSQKSKLFVKILADSVGHVQKWLTIEKAEKHCSTDGRTPQALAVGPFPISWPTLSYMAPLQYMFLLIRDPGI